MRRRVRRGCRRAIGRPSPSARARRPRRARPPRCVRGRRCVERRRGRPLPLATSLLATLGLDAGCGDRTAGGRPGVPATGRCGAEAAWPADSSPTRFATRPYRHRLARGSARPGCARCGGRAHLDRLRPGVRPPSARARTAAPLSDAVFERRLLVARRRVEAAARGAGLGDSIAVPSASCRTIVYKGLVAGARLGGSLSGPRGRRVVVRTRSSTSATRPTRARRGGSPSRSGRSPTTARSTRSAATASRCAAGARTAPSSAGALGELLAAGPLLSADGSDSLSLDEALELLVATGWQLETALLDRHPRGAGPAPRAASRVAALRRRTRRLPRAVGRPGGPRLQRRPPGRRDASTATGSDRGLRDHRGSARRGRRPRPARSPSPPPRPSGAAASARRDAPRRAGDRGASSRTPTPRPRLLRRLPHPRRRRDAPTSTGSPATTTRRLVTARAPRPRRPCAASPGSTRRTPGSTSETMALEGHEPLWSMGDDTPTPGLARVDRPVGDHLRQSFAQVTNPPIDPERERIGHGPPVELGRRHRSSVGRRAAPGRSVSSGRSSPTCRRSRASSPGRRGDSTPRGEPIDGPAGLVARARSAGARGRRGRPRRTELLVLTIARSIGSAPRPVRARRRRSPHRAHRGRAARPRGHRRRGGATSSTSMPRPWRSPSAQPRVVPWLAVELAAEPAGGRGAEELDAADDGRKPPRRVRRRPPQDARPDGHQHGGLVHRRWRCSRASSSPMRSDGAASRARRPGLARSGSRTSPIASCGAAQRRPRSSRALPANKLQDPGFARFRADGELHLYAPRTVAEVQSVSSFAEPRSPAQGDAAAGAARPSVVRDLLRIRRRRRAGVSAVALRRGRARADDRPPVRRERDVPRSAVARGPPGAHDRNPARRRRREHRRGRRGPGVVRGRTRRCASRRADQAGRVRPLRGHRNVPRACASSSRSRSPRAPSPARAASSRRRRRRPGSRAFVEVSRGSATSAHRRTTTSIRSRTSAQLIADLRAINPTARIGVKLVASRGVGTIAAGVAKAGATYIHLAGPCRRHRRVAAQLDQARWGAMGARPGRGPPDAAPERPPRSRRAQDGRRPPNGPRPARRRAAGGRGVRVRDRDARRNRLRHGSAVPSRHVSDRHCLATRGPSGEVRGDARTGRAVRPRGRRGSQDRAGGRRGARGWRGRRRVTPIPHAEPADRVAGSGRGGRRRAMAGGSSPPQRAGIGRPRCRAWRSEPAGAAVERRPARTGGVPRGRPRAVNGRSLVRGPADRRNRAGRARRPDRARASGCRRPVVRGVRGTGRPAAARRPGE